MIIYFYDAKERPYGVLSNYALSTIIIDGVPYDSVEHYYQSQKYVGVNAELVEAIRMAKTPHQAKVLASLRQGGGYGWRTALNPLIARFQELGVKLRADWEQVKEAVMKIGLKAKFTQHANLRTTLMGTGRNEIAEASPIDSYWGTGADGNGQNRLGVLLQEVRESFRVVIQWT